MEQKKPISPVLAGVIIAAIAVVFALITNVLGAEGNSGLGFLQYTIIIIALVILVGQYGKANNNALSFGELFGYGFKATAIYTLIFLIFLVVLMSMSPELKQKTLEQARIQMEKQGRTDEEIDMAVKIADRYYWIALVGGSMFMLVLIGAIGSLLGAAVTKKNPKNPFEQQTI